MFKVYVLESKRNGKHYIGHTENLDKRILEHNNSKDRKKFTCINGPWELLFSDIFETRSEAMKYERFLKSGRGREYIKERLKRIK